MERKFRGVSLRADGPRGSSLGDAMRTPRCDPSSVRPFIARCPPDVPLAALAPRRRVSHRDVRTGIAAVTAPIFGSRNSRLSGLPRFRLDIREANAIACLTTFIRTRA